MEHIPETEFRRHHFSIIFNGELVASISIHIVCLTIIDKGGVRSSLQISSRMIGSSEPGCFLRS